MWFFVACLPILEPLRFGNVNTSRGNPGRVRTPWDVCTLQNVSVVATSCVTARRCSTRRPESRGARGPAVSEERTHHPVIKFFMFSSKREIITPWIHFLPSREVQRLTSRSFFAWRCLSFYKRGSACIQSNTQRMVSLMFWKMLQRPIIE